MHGCGIQGSTGASHLEGSEHGVAALEHRNDRWKSERSMYATKRSHHAKLWDGVCLELSVNWRSKNLGIFIMQNLSPLVLLAPRVTDDSVVIWKAAIDAGWSVERLPNWRAPERLRTSDRDIILYAEPLFAEAVCDAFDRGFLRYIRSIRGKAAPLLCPPRKTRGLRIWGIQTLGESTPARCLVVTRQRVGICDDELPFLSLG